jgi:hypothetical protein
MRDDIHIKEESIIIEFSPALKKGEVQSFKDGNIFEVHGKGLAKAKIENCVSDKVILASLAMIPKEGRFFEYRALFTTAVIKCR